MKLRTKVRCWFDEDEWGFKHGYDVMFHNDVILMRCIEGKFYGPGHLVSILKSGDSKESVLAKLQDWVDHHQTKVKMQLRIARQKPLEIGGREVD